MTTKKRRKNHKLSRGGLQDLLLLGAGGGFHQCRELPNVVRTGIADHEVSQSAFAPGFKIERELARESLVEWAQLRPVLKNKNRDFVFANLEQQMSAAGLLQVGNAAADRRTTY